MVKVEDFQHYGKEQFDTAVATANTVSKGFQAIALELSDFSKKAFEDGGLYLEKLAGVKSFDKAIELNTEYAKSSYEQFVSGVTKLNELYVDLAKQAFKPVEGYLTKFTPRA